MKECEHRMNKELSCYVWRKGKNGCRSRTASIVMPEVTLLFVLVALLTSLSFLGVSREGSKKIGETVSRICKEGESLN